mmetsp:Transcript_10725/g.12294  ORF Transcript_10725/g.12294 Transcript_10725/m.12294 type:complete len:272 (+) Transcript_10725:92-907(+)
MIRAAVSSGVKHRNLRILLTVGRNNSGITKSLFTQKNSGKSLWTASTPFIVSARKRVGCRFLSSGEKDGGGKNAGEKNAGENENQIVLTPGEKFKVAYRLLFGSVLAVFACGCAYYIGSELIPTKMSPNTVFNKALGKIRDNREVSRRFGSPLKGYGRDHGGKREGRRNFIEHTEYKAKEDDSKRTRVRFNLEGPNGKAFCFAEVSNQMPSGEFVYLIVQDKLNGNVITIVDNRAEMAMAKMAGDSKEGQKIFNQLLTGGSSSDINGKENY